MTSPPIPYFISVGLPRPGGLIYDRTLVLVDLATQTLTALLGLCYEDILRTYEEQTTFEKGEE